MKLILQKQFLEIVNRELKARHMTRTELARAMEKSPQYVTEYLNGRRDAGPDVMERFFAALQLEPKLTVVRRKATALAG